MLNDKHETCSFPKVGRLVVPSSTQEGDESQWIVKLIGQSMSDLKECIRCESSL